MGEYFTLFIGAVLINNFVLTKFLGLCIFFGVSKNLNASIGMGFAVTSVITLSTILAWLVYNFVLVPLDLADYYIRCLNSQLRTVVGNYHQEGIAYVV